MVDAVSELAVITPSYAPDLELCSDLNESVLRNTPESVKHYIIVPAKDLKLFMRLRGARTEVLSINDVLPRRFLQAPGANYWLNLRRPYPPIRGWVMQQVVKLQIATQIDSELLLLADSDVFLAHPVNVETFRKAGQTRFYRLHEELHSGMARQLIWYDFACKILGVPGESPPLPDYTCPFNIWERKVVLALQERIQLTTGNDWLNVVSSQLHFGEFTLYGVFVDKVLGARANVTVCESMLCHTYWENIPLDNAEANKFVSEISPSDVAIMISAKSRTPLEVRRKALSRLV